MKTTTLLLSVAALSACNFLKSTEDKLYEARSERTEILEALYTDFGGSDLAGAAEQAEKESNRVVDDIVDGANENGTPIPQSGIDVTRTLLEAASGTVSETDRLVFEDHCMVSGRGERPTSLTDKYRDFFNRAEVKQKCRRVVELSTTIAALEQEVAQDQDPDGQTP